MKDQHEETEDKQRRVNVQTTIGLCPTSTSLHIPIDSPVSGMKFDGEKPDLSLFPMSVASSVSEVLTFGAKKYARNNWQNVKPAVQRYYSALQRHLAALQDGEEIDSDSGLPHIYHVGCNITFLIWFYNNDSQDFMKEIKA